VLVHVDRPIDVPTRSTIAPADERKGSYGATTPYPSAGACIFGFPGGNFSQTKFIRSIPVWNLGRDFGFSVSVEITESGFVAIAVLMQEGIPPFLPHIVLDNAS